MPLLRHRKPRTTLPSSRCCSCGSSTRSLNLLAFRGSLPSPSAAERTWYSSSPSWRLRSCDDTTIGTGASSGVISIVTIARWRWTRLTRRVDDTFTRLPDGVRHSRSRRKMPSRKSIDRSYSARSAVPSSNGSSSTYSFINLPSGTLTMVWPVVANPYASSACLISQVSWKPFRKVPWLCASRPSSGLERMPR